MASILALARSVTSRLPGVQAPKAPEPAMRVAVSIGAHAVRPQGQAALTAPVATAARSQAPALTGVAKAVPAVMPVMAPTGSQVPPLKETAGRMPNAQGMSRAVDAVKSSVKQACKRVASHEVPGGKDVLMRMKLLVFKLIWKQVSDHPL